MNADAALLGIDNVSVAFGGRRVVQSVSFAVPVGKAVGVVGESGAGKSSLMRAILGLAPIADGRISWKGADVTKLKPADRRRRGVRMGVVFQDPYASLNPRLPVWRIVTEQALIDGERDDEAMRVLAQEALERVGLDPSLAIRRPTALSGGQRQRVAIARALVGGPELLLLDEPTSSLDVTVQAQILALLGQLRRDLTLSFVMISHDLMAVRSLCEQVCVMRAGEVVEQGSTEAIFSSPQSAYVRELVAATPRLNL